MDPGEFEELNRLVGEAEEKAAACSEELSIATDRLASSEPPNSSELFKARIEAQGAAWEVLKAFLELRRKGELPEELSKGLETLVAEHVRQTLGLRKMFDDEWRRRFGTNEERGEKGE
jgi:hypothetical protein